jgi:putative secreted sulfatase ydeN
LYNLKEDIGERKNLRDDCPQKADELSRVLEKWLKTVDAQLPSENPTWDAKRERKTGKYAGLD